MIIFINGSINSGKSTIAKRLSEKIPNSIVLEIDVLRDFIKFVSLDKAIPINLENAVSLTKNFINHNFSVIIPYPLSKKNYNFLFEGLRDVKEKIYTFTLNPSIETVLEGRGRTLTGWEKERIKHHYKIKINKPDFGMIIDNSHQTPDETTNQILTLLK